MTKMTATFRFQTTQSTRGGVVTVVWHTMCKLCRPLPPPALEARLPFLDKPAMLLIKRAMSRLIQVRLLHANMYGFAISATDKYKLRSRYR